MTKFCFAVAGAMMLSFSIKAQDTTGMINQSAMSIRSQAPIRKPYWGNSLDGMIFSASRMDPKLSNQSQAVRFSMFLNIGFTYNYNFCNAFGIYTGLDVKNIGYITKNQLLGIGEQTIKRRVYTIGLPVGLRLGNMKKRDYFFLGGGLDLAFHYKEKEWIEKRSSKTKFSEWFSSRNETLMPYVYAGFGYHGTTIKVQYYPGSFMNQDYVSTDPVSGIMHKPYAGQKVNLILFSIGRDMKYGRK
ncbi:outer membrane beta-barrel protein [Rurimicrobium arvi]